MIPTLRQALGANSLGSSISPVTDDDRGNDQGMLCMAEH